MALIFTYIFWISLAIYLAGLIAARAIYWFSAIIQVRKQDERWTNGLDQTEQQTALQIPWLNNLMGWFMPTMLTIIGLSGFVMVMFSLRG